MTKRREFLKKSALGTAGIAIGGMGFSARMYSDIQGANERINMAVIGIRIQGNTRRISSTASGPGKHQMQI